MATGICVFAENSEGKLASSVAELITAAYEIKKTTGEKVTAILMSENCETISKELASLGVEEILAYKTEKDIFLQDDLTSQIVSELIKQMDPSCVLIPATAMGRSIFSRVAMKLECGLTADCIELLPAKRSSGDFYIKQNKPSFGENVMVTIVTKEGVTPQMMTVRPGVYKPVGKKKDIDSTKIVYAEQMVLPESKIKVIDVSPVPSENDNIMAADVVVIGGRGCLEGNNFELMTKFAEKIGAAIGGTRPLADSGKIPFEHQIGQTGYTIRPKICISLGVSGAIQHTEGIKDTKLMIAINRDENAPIFNIADYGFVCDIQDILGDLLK